MNKIYYNKERDVYQMFVPYPILPFSHIWNPKEEKVITKEHLKLFIEEGFPYNFSRSGSYASTGFNSNDNTPISDFVQLYTNALMGYLFGRDELYLFNETDDKVVEYFVDSTAVYKLFAHLLTEENFSCLLSEQQKTSIGVPYVVAVSHESFIFVSSKEKLNFLEKTLTIFEIEDEVFFAKCLDEEFFDLEESKKRLYSPSTTEKLNRSFEGLDKYLN